MTGTSATPGRRLTRSPATGLSAGRPGRYGDRSCHRDVGLRGTVATGDRYRPRARRRVGADLPRPTYIACTVGALRDQTRGGRRPRLVIDLYRAGRVRRRLDLKGGIGTTLDRERCIEEGDHGLSG